MQRARKDQEKEYQDTQREFSGSKQFLNFKYQILFQFFIVAKTMEAVVNSLWNWAVIQLHHAVGSAKLLWQKLLDLLCLVRDSFCDLISSLRARFCYSNESESITTSPSVSSSPGKEFTEKVEVRRRKTGFEFEVGNPPAKRLKRSKASQEKLESEIKAMKGAEECLKDIRTIMEKNLRASSPAEAEKTTAELKDLLDSSATKKMVEDLRTANLSLV